MNDFSLIPDDNVKKTVTQAGGGPVQPEPAKVVSFGDIQDKQIPVQAAAPKKKIEAVSPNQPTKVEGAFFMVAIIIFITSLGYTAFLFTQRYLYIKSINSSSEEIKAVKENLNLEELQDFKTLNQKINIVKDRISKHVLSTRVITEINKYIRSSIQVSDYSFVVGEKDVVINFSCIAPSFRDMAEQTEKLFEIRQNGLIKKYSITNLSYEYDTRRVRFTVSIEVDKSHTTVDSAQFSNNSIR